MTPEPTEPGTVLVAADPAARGAAMLVDVAVLWVVSFALLAVLGLIHGPVIEVNRAGDLADRISVDRGRFAIDTAVLTAASGVYFAGAWRRWGRTLGQRAFGLSVRSGDHGPISVPAAVARWLVTLAVPVWVAAGLAEGNLRLALWGVGGAWYVLLASSTAWGSGTRGIHDRLVGTMVLRRVEPVHAPAWPVLDRAS